MTEERTPSTHVEAAHKDGVSFGIALSIAFLLRDRDEPVIAREWWQASGLTIEDLHRIGVDDYDLAPIREEFATAAEGQNYA